MNKFLQPLVVKCIKIHLHCKNINSPPSDLLPSHSIHLLTFNQDDLIATQILPLSALNSQIFDCSKTLFSFPGEFHEFSFSGFHFSIFTRNFLRFTETRNIFSKISQKCENMKVHTPNVSKGK